MKNIFGVFVLLVIVISEFSYSQDTVTTILTTKEKEQLQAGSKNLGHAKNPTTAFWAGVGSTILPIGIGASIAFSGSKHSEGREQREAAGFLIALAGAEIGPSIGNFYAGNQQRGMIGLLVRGAGFFIIYDGLKGYGKWDRIDDQDRKSGSGSYFDQMYLGMGIVLGGAIWDIATAPRSAREYNKKHGLSFSPVLDPVQRSASIAINYRF